MILITIAFLRHFILLNQFYVQYMGTFKLSHTCIVPYWRLEQEFAKAGVKVENKLARPGYGNYVKHERHRSLTDQEINDVTLMKLEVSLNVHVNYFPKILF